MKDPQVSRKDLEKWVREAINEPDDVYQLVEVCRTVAELERERCARLVEEHRGDKIMAEMIRALTL